MKKRKFLLGLFAMLIVMVFAISCCFLFACGDKEEVEPTPGVEDDESKNDDKQGDEDEGDKQDDEKKEDDTKSYTITVDTVVAVPVAVDYNGASFENESDFVVTGTENSDGSVSFAAEGTAATMNADQAAAFGAGAKEGDAYVVIGILSNVGDTITWTTSLGENKSWTKVHDETKEEDDDLALVDRISENSTNCTFTMTSADGATAKVCVALDEVKISGSGEGGEITNPVWSNTYDLSGVSEDLKNEITAFDGSTKTEVVLDEKGILTFKDSNTTPKSHFEDGSYAFKTGGKTDSKMYFTIDLKDFESYKVSVSVTAHAASSTADLELRSGTYNGDTVTESKTSSTSSEIVTIEYTGVISSSEKLCITFTASMYIDSVTIVIY